MRSDKLAFCLGNTLEWYGIVGLVGGCASGNLYCVSFDKRVGEKEKPG